MSEDSNPQQSLKLMSFPPSVLSRISPEISLQRHLSIGLRPNLRKFDEFRDIQLNDGGLSRYSANNTNGQSDVLGSSILRSGSTMVVCTIRGQIVEEDILGEAENEDADAINAIFAKELQDAKPKETLKDNAVIYPLVEVERGRVGPPTDEEMILSQRIYENFLHSGILKRSALKVNVGLKSVDENGEEQILYKGENDQFDFGPKRMWSYTLSAEFKVFSRSGPLYELLWTSLISALRSTKLPHAYIDENAADIKVPIKMRGNFGTVREQYQITCDANKSEPLSLELDQISYGTNFAVIDIVKSLETTLPEEEGEEEGEAMDVDTEQKSVLLIDIEGEEEEFCAKKVIQVSVDSKGESLKSLTLSGGIDRDSLRTAIQLAKSRSRVLDGVVN
ncbi:hypothetical protein WICPIJ_003720 [Wickerhamomyces pijperi]|uniref:Ribosomal RNA-processing protein 43 n=1 Tax=Wickerhamomyces pijperi TaxID=599730 RepID=A0A9P8Q6M3_WICPI|nr:hypothetical protein WICPIJ_003720 [Wickerhamomyces pijperi]